MQYLLYLTMTHTAYDHIMNDNLLIFPIMNNIVNLLFTIIMVAQQQ